MSQLEQLTNWLVPFALGFATTHRALAADATTLMVALLHHLQGFSLFCKINSLA